MEDQKITSKERFDFAATRVAGAGKWIILSGTATYFLTELAELLGEFDMPKWLVLTSYFAINVLLFAIGQFIQGQEN